MSDAADRLARSRLAILQQLERRERRRGGSERETRSTPAAGDRADNGGGDEGEWFGGVRHALRTWWRHHPAQMGLEIATPMLSAYARRYPARFLGVAAVIGAVVVVARPWRLISVGLVVALLKSSQISSLVMSAMAGADFRKDRPPYDG